MRIHTLAKELGIQSKDLIERLSKMGVKVKGHMSSVDEETAEIMRQEVKPKAKPEKARVPKAEPKRDAKPAVKPAPETGPEPEPEQKPAPKLEEIEVDFPISVKQLATKINAKPNDLIKELMKSRILAHLNQALDEEKAAALAEARGYRLKKAPSLEEELLKEHREGASTDEKSHKLRAPIVTFMGHVDHGKTSLLDYIRKTRVVAREKGGITQHIGAYEVALGNKGKITFLDTPGHQAFTAMRARGANVTDIVVLVVAADDGVMPQTIEAIDHARAAGVPIVVAVNKCDLPNINLDKVKKQLSGHDLMPEEWGGKTIMVPVSAKTGEGIDKLLEMLLLEAEILELKSNPEIRARGIVVEAKLSPGQGSVATLLVKNGTLKLSDIILTGDNFGRVKAMINDRGKRVGEAPPASAVEVLGLSGVPQAGEEFFVVKDEKKAKTLATLKEKEKRDGRLKGMKRMSLEDLYKQVKEGAIKELKVILKGDVQGSLEALKNSLDELSTDEVKLSVSHMGTGNVNESDVMLALVSNAIIIGFNVKVEPKAEEIAKKEQIEIKLYGIIYEAIADVKAALEGLLEPISKEVFSGRAQVRQVFNLSRAGVVAGCYVSKGVIPRSGRVRIVRNKQVIFDGRIKSIKHHKDDVKEIREGFECGITLEGHNDVKTGDLIESYRIEHVTRRLNG